MVNSNNCWTNLKWKSLLLKCLLCRMLADSYPVSLGIAFSCVSVQCYSFHKRILQAVLYSWLFHRTRTIIAPSKHWLLLAVSYMFPSLSSFFCVCKYYKMKTVAKMYQHIMHWTTHKKNTHTFLLNFHSNLVKFLLYSIFYI